MNDVIRSPTAVYRIDKPLARGPTHNIYLVTDEKDGGWFMLKVSLDVPGNGRLDREALVLKDIEVEVERIRSTEVPGATGGALRYEKCFPRLRESFLLKKQGNRRINIIEIPDTDSAKSLVPIEQWRTRERVRIDPKTSAWIMGRLLKVFTLTHPIGVSIGKIDGGNILVNPEIHRAIFFDWTEAHQYEMYVPGEKVGEEIAQAATQVFIALGGNLATGMLPAHEQLLDTQYAELLLEFMSGRMRDPDKASQRFYKLVREMWAVEFHPFTTIPL
jgi:hypothetical protein